MKKINFFNKNKMKYWITGGIILNLIVFMLILIAMNGCGGEGCLVLMFLPFLPAGMILLSLNLTNTGPILIFSSFIFYFVIGSLIGLIIEKARRGKKSL